MKSTKRVPRLAVSVAMLAGGALVAGPAATASAPTPAESTTVQAATASPQGAKTQGTNARRVKTADVKTSAGARGARKFKCGLGVIFKPRFGKKNRWIRSGGRVRCNRKVRRIWTSVHLVQTKAHNKYKITNRRFTRRNRTVQLSFCPRESRRYKLVVKATVRLPKSAKKKQFRLRHVERQRGHCR